MILCDRDHEQICFDGGSCPLCDAMDTISDQDIEIDDLTTKLEEYSEQE